jgi:hypothetical protein
MILSPIKEKDFKILISLAKLKKRKELKAISTNIQFN